MNSSTEKQVIDFLVNDDFINYVICPTNMLRGLWESYFHLHPELMPAADKARQILLGESDLVEIPPQDILEMKRNIFNECNLSY